MTNILMTRLYFLLVAALFSFTLAPSCEAGREQGTMKVTLSFNDTVLTATLYDNATTRSLARKLPLRLVMRNLYSREMVFRFPEPLPTDDVAVRGYEVGEIVYYPPRHSFVILYAQNGERFSMQGLGRIDSGLELFQDTEEITVTIAAMDSDL